MNRRLAILCPGQGAQHAAMFDLARGNSAVGRQIDAWALPASGDPFANRHAQPLLVGAGCATWEALRADIGMPAIVAGYSVGEVTALAVAGVLPAAAAVQLAARRASLMDACVDPALPQGLCAVTGTVRSDLERILTSAPTCPAPAIAIENAPDQFIIGGTSAGLATVQPLLRSAGATLQQLPVTIASHTALMQAAVVPLQELMASMPFAAPATRLLAGISGDPVIDGAHAIKCLALQTAQQIRWSRCMDTLAEAGIRIALELGPGTAMSRMLSARHPDIACRSVAEFRSIGGVLSWLKNQ